MPTKIFLIVICLFAFTASQGQSWKEKMHDPNVNIYDVVQEAEAYFLTVDINAKGSGWKAYQRWLYENEPKFYPSGDRSTANPYFVTEAYQAFLQDNPGETSLILTDGWRELGPHYVEQVTGHYSVGLGRIESFYVDPNNSDRIYIGSRSGGFWKTNNGGNSWIGNTTDFLTASGVNTIAVSINNPDHVLINVRNARNNASHGIYRSTNAGDSWEITAFNPSNLGWGGLGTVDGISKIAYHPSQPNQVFIATSEGLYRSSDDLQTWTQPINNMSIATIYFHPTNPNIVYVSSNSDVSNIYVSTDGGNSFNPSGNIPGNGSTIRMSTSPACPNCVYVASSGGVWKSDNQGQTFNLLSNPGISNYGGFVVSDVDPNIILIGDIDTHMSYNEGASFDKVTFWAQGNANYNSTGTYVHADIRGAQSINGVIWVNTDGFLGYSSDFGLTWSIFEGQSIRENYNLGVSQSNHFRTICGSQDNGTSIITEDGWLEFYGADGMEGIIHPLNDDYIMGSVQYGTRRRTTDGGFSQNGATPPGQDGYWIAPLFYDPNDQMVIYSLGENIHRSEDFGGSWEQLGSPGFSGNINYATIAENDSKVIAVSRSNNLEISHDGGVSFTSITGSLPNNFIRDIAFDPNDDDVIIVVYGTHENDGNKVFLSTDQGVSWQNISYNLNDMPVRAVAIDHTDASTIYLGTEIGVYKKAMADDTWSLYNLDLPNVSVLELDVMYGSNTLRAATWGRGLWEYSLDNRQDYPAILTTRTTDLPTATTPNEETPQFVTSTISYEGDLTDVYLEWSADAPVFGNLISMSNTMDSTWVSDEPLPDQPAGTKMFFKVFAVGNNGDVSETYKFMYEVREFGPCPSYGNMSYTTAVTLVDFQDIYNATGKTQPYTDYSDTEIATVGYGNSYDLNVNVDTDGNYTIYAKAWIDWNRDADFDDPGETFDMGSAVNTPDGPTNLSPLSITVPLDAEPGLLSMRVSAKYNSSPTSCETGFDGEVEDYSVLVEHGYILAAINTGICAGDSIYLQNAWQTTAGIYYDTVSISPMVDSVYITTLSIYNQSSSTLDVSSCDSYTVPSGEETYFESGMYMDTIPNVSGCDSVLAIILDIVEVDTTVTINNDILFANATDASYQWIDCETMEEIPGETNQSFAPGASGLFALQVTQNGCTETSDCYLITYSSTIENNFGSKLLVYPNPTSGSVTLDLGENYASIHTSIIAANGIVIRQQHFENAKEITLNIEEPDGIYFIEIRTPVATGVEKKATLKIVKKE